jgi:capsular polysaccharide biosynthesis protein
MYDPMHNSSNERTAPTSATQEAATYGEVGSYLSLKDLLHIFWRRLWIVIMITFVVVGSAVGFSLGQKPVYEASTRLLLGQKSGQEPQVNLMGSIEGLQQLTHTVATAVDSRPVAEEVIQRHALQMNSQDFLDNLTVEQIEDTQFLLLSYRDTDPERAKEIVDGVSDASTQRISEANATRDDITITVWEYAAIPTSPISPNPIRNGLLAFGLGLMLGIGLAFLLEYLDDRWRSPEEVEQVSGVPTFGVIPEFQVSKKRRRKVRRTLEGA